MFEASSSNQWYNILQCLFFFPNIYSNYLLVTQSVGLSKKKLENMGRGVSSGGGQSSLGYLFGSGEAPKPAANNTQAAPIPNEGRVVTNEPASKPTAPPPAPEPVDITKQIPAGIHSTSSNNYMRADGQNTGNFITDRPSTKVHSAPGGGSSLDYLFGGPGGN
ncbi:unnamed protein product [Prunus armeniaca]